MPYLPIGQPTVVDVRPVTAVETAKPTRRFGMKQAGLRIPAPRMRTVEPERKSFFRTVSQESEHAVEGRRYGE